MKNVLIILYQNSLFCVTLNFSGSALYTCVPGNINLNDPLKALTSVSTISADSSTEELFLALNNAFCFPLKSYCYFTSLSKLQRLTMESNVILITSQICSSSLYHVIHTDYYVKQLILKLEINVLLNVANYKRTHERLMFVTWYIGELHYFMWKCTYPMATDCSADKVYKRANTLLYSFDLENPFFW